MDIRIYGLVNDSIVDGPGFRLAIFTQGCPHNCKGCHNPGTHDFNAGELVDVEDVINALGEIRNQDGITLSGGDPVCQSDACYEISKAAHEMGLNVWCYTGFTYEKMLQNPKHRKLLEEVDVLVDGKSVNKEPNEVRQKIGFLTSELKLEDFFTPNYLFDFFSELHNVPQEKRESQKKKLFDRFGIGEFAEVKIANLSTGMKQKASLAISLVHDPDIVIFDVYPLEINSSVKVTIINGEIVWRN